jgi:uncharacterized protein
MISQEWPADLDVAGQLASGFRPRAFREFVLKVHQRCNLACDYCYVYEHADQSWRGRPVSMSPQVWRAAVARLGEHVRRHGLTSVRVVLHGGEPLLFGVERLGELAAAVRAELPAGCVVEVALQTNAVLLDEAAVVALAGHGIRVGVSVDGVAADHDRHRRRPNGSGSFAAVERGIGLLRQHPSAYAGILCTVAPQTDPIACWEQLLAFTPPMIDFLLPHANWAQPPERAGLTSYADWLIPIFDRWFDGPQQTRIRLFEDVLSLLLGGGSRGEQVGLAPAAVVVIESDGAIEQVDALKTAYEGACGTGLSVLTDDLDAALRDPGLVARQIGRRALAAQCRQCPVLNVCGGGHYAHRYRAGQGFRNPSVYCADLQKLIGHIQPRVAASLRDLASTVVDRSESGASGLLKPGSS